MIIWPLPLSTFDTPTPNPSPQGEGIGCASVGANHERRFLRTCGDAASFPPPCGEGLGVGVPEGRNAQRSQPILVEPTPYPDLSHQCDLIKRRTQVDFCALHNRLEIGQVSPVLCPHWAFPP